MRKGGFYSMKLRKSLLMAVVFLLTMACLSLVPVMAEEQDASEGVLPLTEYWSAGSPVAESLRNYVDKVTNEEDPENFIPVEDRIAVFDMDGTLTCETFFTYYDTMMYIDYCNTRLDSNDWLSEKDKEELKQVAKEITPEYKAGEELARNFARAYSGMTVEELYDYAVEFGQKETASFVNMRYLDGFYLPMVELVKYLYENDFTVYVISGTERTTTRAIVANSPIKDYVTPNHVIGTEFEIKLENHEKTSSNMDFKYGEDGEDDKLVITGGFVQKNLNANKTIDIEREIGQRPVLAFGNSGSDTSMMNYAIIDNQYPAQAYMVIADDSEREWGAQDWTEKSEAYSAMGYIPVSMKDDFAQIYPEPITKAETQYEPADEETEAIDDEERFPSWDPDSPALAELIDFVSACTDESSPDYIPEEDRIATFDMDGTLMGELFPTYLEVILLTDRILADPAYEPDEEMLEFGRMTRDHALDKSFPDDYDYQFSYHQAKAFAGMTLDEYADFITSVLLHEADGFEGMTYAEGYYQPMVEVVEYLQENGFQCYVVSGSDRFIVRNFIDGVFDIPSECVIGSDTALEAKNQGDTDGIEYVFTGDDTLVRTDQLIIKDLKTNKVLQIAQEIGHQPVLSFGNSSGDVSMNNYAVCNNKYRSAAFMVVADDDTRDYGNPDKHEELFEKWQGMGYHAISMRDDWRTIYGENVKKTGEFHWLTDYADDRIPSRGLDETDGSETSVLEAIRESGVLKVGTAGDYQPMSYLDPESGAYVGFDAELAEDLADSLGVEIQYVETSWPTLMEDTLAGNFDLAICGITITDARKEQTLMSEGYLENGKTVLCRAEDADKYTSLGAINHPQVRVMENPGGLNEKFARENLPDATLIIHDVNQEIPGLVASGEADVMITEVMEAGYYVGQDSRLAAPLIYEPFTNGQLGVLMPKGSEDLLAYVNAFLEEEKTSGRIEELADEYIYRYIQGERDEAA